MCYGERKAIEGGNDEVRDENAPAAVEDATAKGKKGKQSLIRGEAKFVDRLLARLEALPGPDSKLDGFASGLEKLVENTPDMKVLIFTEYRATQDVLTNTLAGLVRQGERGHHPRLEEARRAERGRAEVQ